MGSTVSSGVISAAQIPFAFLALTGLDSLAPITWPKQAVLQNNASYDYIVVGGGSAGCVVSRRLAEDGNNSVLVLEAGDDPPLPAMIAALFNILPGSYVDYNYTSTKDEFAARGQNNYTKLTAGKMLGGSDSLNHFIHGRGTDSDYDAWAEMSKDNSWKYENILPYFKKSEKVYDKDILSKYGEFHGTEGPMGISRQPEAAAVDILKAFAEVGNPTLLDLNADTYVGYAEPQYMFANYKRQTPAYSYLKPIQDYSNLHVSKNTRVIRIVFEDNVAVGVEAVYKGKTYTFRANKEVILSAGVFNTPQLLMLSGIGPKDHLESHNITVLKDLPVGENLVDQVAVTMVHKLKKYFEQISGVSEVSPLKIPFPVIVGAAALNKTDTYPNYQTFNLVLPHDLPLLTVACAVVFGLRNDICDRWQKQIKYRDSLYTVLTHLQPKSRGYVRLRSTDPFDDPEITMGFYSEREDLEDMVKFVKDFFTVGQSTYFEEIGAKLVGLDIPQCAGKERDTDEYWRCYILEHSGSAYHYTSTCPMGKVVNGKLKVKGIKRLRLVDASVMPKIPRAAPNAAVIMLAEKASDMIKDAN